MEKYYTLYKASYGVVGGAFKDEMTYENAETVGKRYCEKNGFEYLGTYTESEIAEAKMNALRGIAN